MASTSMPSPVDSLNVLGEPLQECRCAPLTGWFRDGSCRTAPADLGRHTVCCVVNEAFLSYSRAQGNDLITPVPAHSLSRPPSGGPLVRLRRPLAGGLRRRHGTAGAAGGFRVLQPRGDPPRGAARPRRLSFTTAPGLAVPGQKSPARGGRTTLQHLDQVGGGLLRGEQARGGHGAPERCRQLRRGGAGVEQGHAGLGQSPPPLDGQGEQQLVLGRLRRPIGVPAAEPVVGDAPHPRRQAGEVHRELLRQGRFDGLSQQQGAIGIHSETSFQGRTADLAQAFLRLQVTVVQQTRRIDHDPQGGQLTDGSVRQPGQAGIVGEVEGRSPLRRPPIRIRRRGARAAPVRPRARFRSPPDRRSAPGLPRSTRAGWRARSWLAPGWRMMAGPFGESPRHRGPGRVGP